MAKVSSIPSKLIYSADVPEVENFNAQFVYNYYVPDESVQDYKNDRLGVTKLARWKTSEIVMTGDGIEYSLNKYGRIRDLKKLPRYVKLSWKEIKSLQTMAGLGNYYQQWNGLLEKDLEKIVTEDQFATNRYTAIESNNQTLVQSMTEIFREDKDFNLRNNFPKTIKSINEVFQESNKQFQASMASIAYQKQGLELKNQTEDSYLQKLRSTKFYSQVNNNFLHSLVVEGLSSTHPNETFLKNFIDYSKSVANIDVSYKLTNEEYKASIPYHKTYQQSVSSILDNSQTFFIAGFIIEKTEVFPDGTINKFPPIVIGSGATTSYLDWQVRYGALYFYSVRTIMDVTYNAVDNETLEFSRVGSYIASKDEKISVLTIEDVAPPPPNNIKIIWDYDRYNPSTALYDHENDKLFPNTGVRGSLLITWCMPVNAQMDIKKFQVFRRKTINDPFELIKMYDFDDSISKFESLESNIDPSIIKTYDYPVLYCFDDDFYKNSEYIYSLACIDAHGLTSNYSEQFKVKFNAFLNKLELELVSIAGAPKQYPNMYLEKDLFVDTIKTINKNTMHVYLTPDCFKISSGENIPDNVLKMKIASTSNISNNDNKYCMNIINTDVQKSRQLNINIMKKSLF